MARLLLFAPPMSVVRLSVPLLVCLLLDFCSPFIGGAFTFEPGQAADGARIEQTRHPERPAAITPGIRPRVEDPALVRAGRAPEVVAPPFLTAWLVGLSRAQVGAASLSSRDDDH